MIIKASARDCAASLKLERAQARRLKSQLAMEFVDDRTGPYELPFAVILYGQPITKKNGKVRTRHGAIISKPAYRAWENDAIDSLRIAWGNRKPVPKSIPLRLRVVYFMGTRRLPDLSNLHEGPQDALEMAGVIVDDVSICDHDGDRAYDPHKPRIELTLERIEGRSSLWLSE